MISRVIVASLKSHAVSYARRISRPTVGAAGVPLIRPDAASNARPSGNELSST